jgi:glycosyltransferase involved in cell wall biosynthesis
MNPGVSVVVAAYNHGRFIAEALSSALTQAYPLLEVVVVDDGSTDGTADIVRPFLRDARARYLRTDHCGVSAARNRGIAATTMPLVAFLDADDVWLPGKLARQVDLFERSPGLAVVYGRRRCVNEQGRLLDRPSECLIRGQVLSTMFRYNFVCLSSTVVRRDVLKEVGGFDEAVPSGVDYDLWLRIAAKYHFDYVDEPVVLYRTGHAAMSSRPVARLQSALRTMDRFLDERGGRALLDPALVRRCYAETYCHLAMARRAASRADAAQWYARALAVRPQTTEAWRGLASLLLPESARRHLRRLLVGADWTCPAPRSPAAGQSA